MGAANGFVTVRPDTLWTDSWGTPGVGTNYGYKFTAPETGTLTTEEIGGWFKTAGSAGLFHLAIFDDTGDGSHPSTIVANSDTGEMSHAGAAGIEYHTYTGTKPVVTGGSVYWLCTIVKDNNYTHSRYTTGGIGVGRAATYPTWSTEASWHTHTDYTTNIGFYAVYSAAGGEYSVSCSLGFGITAGGGEIGDYPEALACSLGLNAANSEIGDFPELLSAGLNLSVASLEVADFMRQVQVSMGLSGGDAEKGEYPETSSIVIFLEGTVTGTTAIIHISSAQFNVASMVSEIAEFVKSINVNLGLSAIASEIANFVRSINVGISVAVNVSEKADFIKGISMAFNLGPTVSEVYVPAGAGEYSKSVSVQILISALVSCSLAISGIVRFIAKDINFRAQAEDINFYILTKKINYRFKAEA
jgi:hypothetical protein